MDQVCAFLTMLLPVVPVRMMATSVQMICVMVRELCTHPFLSAGAACGDQSITDCTAPDTCDSAGICLSNHAPAGIPCTSDGVSTTEDICSYSGTCSHFNGYWARVYEGSDRDYARAIHQTFDLGYITAGYTQSFGSEVMISGC